ncbi:MAG: FG-GAP repeat domain-containing protein [Caldilineaceae bacterium]
MLSLSVNPTVNWASPASPAALAMTPHQSMHPWFRYGRWLLILLLTVLSAVVLTAHPAHAAEPTFSQTMSFGRFEHTFSVAVGDFNGDGLLDIVQGNSLEPSYVYLNDGQGGFRTPALALGEGQGTLSVAVGDLNGDGFLDIVQGNNGRPSYLYLNDGQGGFSTPALALGEGQNTFSVAVGDMNGDGFLDIIQGNRIEDLNDDFIIDEAELNRGITYLYLNDGQGGFPAPTRTLGGIQSTYNVAVGDMNGDGFLDIIQSNSPEDLDNNGTIDGAEAQYGISYLYLNDGQGGFPTPARTLSGVGRTNNVAVGDLNGDGFLDIVQGNNGYLNDGQGGFGLPDFALGDVPTSSQAAVGDINGDGFLDIFLGNNGPESYIYLNDGAGGFSLFGRVLGSAQRTQSVAMGDFNRDGSLDLVQGNYASSSYVYLNDGQGGFDAADSFLESAQRTLRVAVGDLNGDGFLDIVQGNYQERSYLYLNDGQGGFDSVGQAFGGVQRTYEVVVGDLNNDGFLDIVQANDGAPSYVYLNDRQGGFPEPGQVWGNGADTYSVALGDFNGDGFLDLVQGKYDAPSSVYLNNGQGGFDTPAHPLGERQWAGSLAAGDFNGDGLLDIVQGNRVGDFNRNELKDEEDVNNAVSYVYLNDGQGGFASRHALGGVQDTFSVATGDFNGDGFLDIAQGNLGISYLYLNDGQGGFAAGRALGRAQNTTNLTAGDLNGDGFLDLVQAYIEIGQNYLYLNDGQGNFGAGRLFGGVQNTNSVAVGDLNGDGLLDLVQGNDGQASSVYLNTLYQVGNLTNHSPQITVMRPGPTHNANFFSTPTVLDSPTIPLTYTLFDQEGDWVGRVAATYSMDGGGKWLPAVATSTTITTNLTTAPTGVQHVYNWNTFASGFFGQSDNVVLRLVAYSQPLTTTQPITGSYRYTNSAVGATQWASVNATTFPFRVRGTQVRVVNEKNQPLPNALVYRLPTGQFSGATPLADATGQPFRTNAQGYLSGRGALQPGDGLVALLPMTSTQLITFTQQYSYFLTSAAPISSGLALTKLSAPGVLTLTVPTAPRTSTHPLLLYHLLVALEWDARSDELFMTALEDSFQRTSELLFHLTNGQMALGQVDIVPAKSLWKRADLLLYAANDVRPSAAIGGLVNRPMTETVRSAGSTLPRLEPNAYVRGQVHMGVTWDPFGENTTDLGEQWWRALAHELSHYILFLPDNYIGLKPDRKNPTSGKRFLGGINCKNSFMTTTRDPSYTEFLTAAQWYAPDLDAKSGTQQNQCEWTMAAITTGRSDWETITTFYPMLRAPTAPLAGPAMLPLAVTIVVNWQLDDERMPIPTRYFELRDSRRERTRHPNAQVFLYQTQNTADSTDDLVVPLGSPTAGGDRIRVRGAYVGDRLCLYDFSKANDPYFGCINKLTGSEVALTVKPLAPATWSPDLQIRALTTRTLSISIIAETISAPLSIQLFPGDYPAVTGLAPSVTMPYPYTSTVITLSYPTGDLFVRVWQGDSAQPQAEAIARYFIQLPWKPDEAVGAIPEFPERTIGTGLQPLAFMSTAVPVNTRIGDGHGDKMALGGVDKTMLGGSDHLQKFAAPILSPDAQVNIYNPGGLFEPNGIKAIQAVPVPPELVDESWLTPVGSAFFVEPDTSITVTQNLTRAISFTYLQREVPEGYEHTLAIYFLPAGQATWLRLTTEQFVDNRVIADLRPEPGYYAVMSTIMLPPLAPGISPLIYPLPDCRMAINALASLQGKYSAIYRLEPNGVITTAVDRLEFGKTYLLKIDSEEPVTPFLAPPRRAPDGELLSNCH